MDYESYRKAFFREPAPGAKFDFVGLLGITLYYSDYDRAIDYYTQALGPPAYVEGANTKGWQLNNSWLTLLRGTAGNPQNTEINIIVDTPQEAERLQAAFVEAGGKGAPPSDQLMYTPIRSCPVTDPFGTDILIFCPIPHAEYHRET